MNLPESTEAIFVIEIRAAVKLEFKYKDLGGNLMEIQSKVAPTYEAMSELHSVISKYPEVFKGIEIFGEELL